MLLRQEDCDGVTVLAVSGRVDEREADGLVTATERVLQRERRAVVLDLAEAAPVTGRAREKLSALLELPSGWPRSPLLLCPETLLPQAPPVMLAADRATALAQVGARAGRARAFVTVPHDPTAPAQARAAIRQSGHLSLDDVSEDVALLVSEMVTNAVRHAAPPIALEVEATDEAVVVAVHDGSPAEPAVRSPEPDAEGGRGMLLVEALAAEHGVRRQPPGKTVWARILRRRAT